MQEKSIRGEQPGKKREKVLRNSIEEITPNRNESDDEDSNQSRSEADAKPKGDSTRNKGKKP